VVRPRQSGGFDSYADRAAHDTTALRDDTDFVERFAGEDVGDIECRHRGAAHDLKIAGDHEAHAMHDRALYPTQNALSAVAGFAAFSSLRGMREFRSVQL